MKGFNKFYFELIFWLVALLLLANSDPNARHFTLCPLANLGITWCPRCGIGHAIAHIFRGNFVLSFQEHWLGIPALAVILYRIYQLTQLTRNKGLILN